MWMDVMRMSKWATKNVRILNSCMTSLFSYEPLFSAVTRLRLSHWNNTDFLASCGLHTAQLHTMGTSSLAIMPSSDYAEWLPFWGHFH